MKLQLTFIFFLMFFNFCFAQNKQTSYKDSIEQWHEHREASLKSETGWLTVAGLYWLTEGENTAGCSKENKIIFPKGKADDFVGTFTLINGEVRFKTASGVEVAQNGKLFNSGIIFNDTLEEQSVILAHKDLRWFIIKRGNKYGVRMRDMQSVARKNFTHIDRFPVDKKWKIIATYQAPLIPKTIPILDVIGLTTETPFGGTLNFEIKGKKYHLDATLEDDDLFIVFADETSGITTYGGGRFIYAKKPLVGNSVIIDFNKAYNPPCAFTDFATCPLPPDQNKIPLPIKAGEKKYNH